MMSKQPVFSLASESLPARWFGRMYGHWIVLVSLPCMTEIAPRKKIVNAGNNRGCFYCKGGLILDRWKRLATNGAMNYFAFLIALQKIFEFIENMKKIDAKTPIRLAIVAVQILFLCSCAIAPHANRADDPARNRYMGPSGGHPDKTTTADGASSAQQEITLSQAMEKEGLNVSYSMTALPGEKGYLVRLSLVVRNTKDKFVGIAPQIALSDASGNKAKAYTKKAFLNVASHMSGETPGNGIGSLIKINGSDKSTARERMEWANTYWLKRHYKIPPHGIEIGELIYYCASLHPPMKLTVDLAGQEFVFTTKDLI